MFSLCNWMFIIFCDKKNEMKSKKKNEVINEVIVTVGKGILYCELN